MQKWVENGEDLTSMFPVLSVFMGHKSFGATSRYLRLTAEVYPAVVRQVEGTCGYPSLTPVSETTSWQKDDDLLDWLKNLGK